MNVLVFNLWSSSIKFKLFNLENNLEIFWWSVENIGLADSIFKLRDLSIIQNFSNHDMWLSFLLSYIFKEWFLNSYGIKHIDYIGHRVVHGWEYFKNSTFINDEVISKIHELCDLAPLHNPVNLLWIKYIKNNFPDIKQYAVFDTSFHSSMKAENYLYAIPYSLYEKYSIRRYGFHGISHNYVIDKLFSTYNLSSDKKIISCHIGNWASVCAYIDNRVIETSMWFTPLEWLVMWTRSWDLDPAIVDYISSKEGLSTQEVINILNKKSGILWLSEKTSNLKEIVDLYITWDEKSILALDLYINRIIKYIWSYISLMWWADFIIFTAWVLENSEFIRKKIIDRLSYLWVNYIWKLWDEIENNNLNIVLIPTNEELMIAMEINKLKK